MTYDIVIFDDQAFSLGLMKGIGPARIASELRSHGYSCKVVDFVGRIMLDPNLFRSICESIIGPNTLWVGWSSNGFGDWQSQLQTPGAIKKMFKEYDRFHKYPVPEQKFALYLRWLKHRWPTVKQVYGGVKAWPEMDLINEFDYVVCGMADSMTVELTNHLKHGSPLKYRPSFKSKWKIMDHDNLGASFDFVNSFTKYETCDHLQFGEGLKLETSRGCRFKCKFCSYPLIGRKVTDPGYHRSTQCLAEELRDNWQRWGTNRYLIVDDTFNETTEKIETLMRARDMAKIDAEFACFARIELIDKQPMQLSLLKELGVISYFFGIETFTAKSGACIGKGMHPDKVKEILAKVKESHNNRVNITSGFMIGLPYETPETMQATLEYLDHPNCPIDSPRVNALDLNQRSEFKSEFERNYQKYGYRKIGDVWHNDIWNSLDWIQLAEQWFKNYCATTGGPTLGFGSLMQVMNLGYTFDQIGMIRWENLPWAEIDTRIDDYYNRYIQTLLTYESVQQ